jgi:hypothetical protein
LQGREPRAKDGVFDGSIEQPPNQCRIARVQSGQKSAKDCRVTIVFWGKPKLCNELMP